jgi:hypothetical protein
LNLIKRECRQVQMEPHVEWRLVEILSASPTIPTRRGAPGVTSGSPSILPGSWWSVRSSA